MEPLNIADIAELVRCAHHNIIKDQRHIWIVDSLPGFVATSPEQE